MDLLTPYTCQALYAQRVSLTSDVILHMDTRTLHVMVLNFRPTTVVGLGPRQA